MNPKEAIASLQSQIDEESAVLAKLEAEEATLDPDVPEQFGRLLEIQEIGHEHALYLRDAKRNLAYWQSL